MTKNYKNYLDDGLELINLSRFEEAKDKITKSIEMKNDWEISYFYRAVANQCLNNHSDAILDYTKAIKLNKKMTDAYFNIAKILFDNCKNDDRNQLEKIKQYLIKAIELDENFIDALFSLAAVEKKLANYESALFYLDKILSIEPEAINARAFKKLLLQKYIKN